MNFIIWIVVFLGLIGIITYSVYVGIYLPFFLSVRKNSTENTRVVNWKKLWIFTFVSAVIFVWILIIMTLLKTPNIIMFILGLISYLVSIRLSYRITYPESTSVEAYKFTLYYIYYTILITIINSILTFGLRNYIGSPYQVSGHSMDMSYPDRSFLLVNKFSYADFGIARVGNPERGDVVILKPHAANGKEYYIKRVIGLPGETVKFDSGEVYIKKVGSDKFLKINEDYLSPVNKGKTFLPLDVKETEFAVPADEYFVMGDNRNNSSDSRSCFMSCSIPGSAHFVARDNVIGKVFLDFGYKNILSKNDPSAPPDSRARFFDTPKDWDYKELY